MLQLLADANFRLSVPKCTVATDRIDYLGYSIHHGLIRPNNDNIRGLLDTSASTSSREVFRFVKAAEHYRKFIRNFSTIATPLYKHAPSPTRPSSTSKTTVFRLTPEETIVFDRLKHILTGDLVLRLPNLDLPFKVQTDTSQAGIGAVLLQSYPEGERPVCFMSKKLTPSQQRWPAIEQECFAIITAVKHWHHYLHGQHFILETDHRPLEALLQKTQQNSKCERWRLLLQTDDFTVKHIPGASNYMPDYLSRSPVDPPSDDPDDAPDLSTVTTLPAAVSSPSVNVFTTRSRARQTSTLPANSSPSHSTSDLLLLPTPPVSPPATADVSNELRINIHKFFLFIVFFVCLHGGHPADHISSDSVQFMIMYMCINLVLLFNKFHPSEWFIILGEYLLFFTMLFTFINYIMMLTPKQN